MHQGSSPPYHGASSLWLSGLQKNWKHLVHRPGVCKECKNFGANEKCYFAGLLVLSAWMHLVMNQSLMEALQKVYLLLYL